MCAAAIVAASIGPFWRIRDIAIEGAHHVAVDAVVTASGLLEAQTFTASAARARDGLLHLPAVRDARIEIRIPDRARVVLSERVAIARWISSAVLCAVKRACSLRARRRLATRYVLTS